MYNWSNEYVRYVVPNAMMAEHYYDRYAATMHLTSCLRDTAFTPNSCADLLARVLPDMDFAAVVKFPTTNANGNPKSPLSSGGLPHEDQYSAAMGKVLDRLKINWSAPLNPNDGKVDLFATFNDGSTCVIENIMATSSQVSFSSGDCMVEVACIFHSTQQPCHSSQTQHSEHLRRFNQINSNYHNAMLKCMVTIGLKQADVLDHLNQHKHKSVDIIGLVVSQAHDSYTMHVKPAGSEDIEPPVFFVCDRVAKALQTNMDGTVAVVSAQVISNITLPGDHAAETTSTTASAVADGAAVDWEALFAAKNPEEYAEYTKKRQAEGQPGTG